MQYMQNWMLNRLLSSGHNTSLKYLDPVAFKCFPNHVAIQLRHSPIISVLLMQISLSSGGWGGVRILCNYCIISLLVYGIFKVRITCLRFAIYHKWFCCPDCSFGAH